MSDRKPLFAECMTCGERWKVATTLMELGKFAKLLKNARCPNCAETAKKIGLCYTEGPDAVTQARNGKEIK